MKIRIDAKLENKKLPIDNRPAFVSFLKHSFQDGNDGLYEKYYGKKIIAKNFCFAVKLDNPLFHKNEVELNDKNVVITIHTNSFEDGIDIYNSLLRQRGIAYPFPENNTFIVQGVKISNHALISTNEVNIKMLSPMLVRCHENNKDCYLAYNENDFNKYFLMSAYNSFKAVGNAQTKDEMLTIEPLSPKKTVVNTFGNKITGNLGIYRLTGSIDSLNFLYQIGLGSRRSQGFGLFEIVSGR